MTANKWKICTFENRQHGCSALQNLNYLSLFQSAKLNILWSMDLAWCKPNRSFEQLLKEDPLHLILLQQKLAETLIRENSECIVEITSHFNQAEPRIDLLNTQEDLEFLQAFLRRRNFKENGCLELFVIMKSRFLYDMHSHALLFALEMVTISSEGAGSGEVVSYGLTLKNVILEPQLLT